MASKNDPSRIEALELSIDSNMSALRREMFDAFPDEEMQPLVATFMRAAYGKGLIDALAHPENMRKFVRDHGYKLP